MRPSTYAARQEDGSIPYLLPTAHALSDLRGSRAAVELAQAGVVRVELVGRLVGPVTELPESMAAS